MSLYPLMIDGSGLTALVVGGGRVATRKVRGLVSVGARVRVVAPEFSSDLRTLAKLHRNLKLRQTRFRSSHLSGAMLVVAATDDAETNGRVAQLARARGQLVNVADAPALGNCSTPAVHRSGDVVVAVSAGGVPAAAVQVRNRIASAIDSRYADAVRQLSGLRRNLLASGRRLHWAQLAGSMIGSDFCAAVESGDFMERLAEWR